MTIELHGNDFIAFCDRKDVAISTVVTPSNGTYVVSYALKESAPTTEGDDLFQKRFPTPFQTVQTQTQTQSDNADALQSVTLKLFR